MQVSDMRALRVLYSQKHNFLSLSSHKSSSSCHTCVSCKFPQNSKFSRQIHFSQYRKSPLDSAEAATAYSIDGSNSGDSLSTSKNDVPVETFYDPISGSIRTRRDYNHNTKDKEAESSSVSQSNGDNSLSTVEQIDSVGTRVYGEEIGSSRRRGKGKGKGKSKTTWVCSNCGYSDGQWWGYCKSCNASGSMKQFSLSADSGGSGGKVTGFEVSENLVRSWLPKKSTDAGPIRLTDVKRGSNSLNWRIPLSGLFGAEVGRVFGGGLVPGSLVLVGGDPGVGKSTLLLKTAAIISEGHGSTAGPVVYISGEESIEQIGNRADRMSIRTAELFLYSSTDIEDILEKAKPLSPRALVVDSIQTVYLKGVAGSAGSLIQVKECTSALLRFAKGTNTPVLVAGHVTKSGDIAGPRVLEHIVDVVLYLEGEKSSSHRLLRAVKNRFGSTDEVGVFEMTLSGLQVVSNPSEMFLSEDFSDSEVLAGLAVAVIMDGSRAFLIEIQALCVAGSSIQRQVNGVQASRADMIIAVLTKQVGLKLQENGIFLNVVSGYNLSETAGDLSIAAAICSSFLEFPIPRGLAFIGEVGLAGEVRTVSAMEKRASTLAQLGYKKCIVPKFAETYLSTLDLGDMQIVGCRNLKEMINSVFRTG